MSALRYCYLTLFAILLNGFKSCLTQSNFRLNVGREYDRSFLTSHLTWFSSPNFPFNYTGGINSRYSFIVDHHVSLNTYLCFQFMKFKLRQSTDCSDDSLVFEGVGKFCGDGWKDGDKTSINIFKPFCVPLSGTNKYIVTFTSADYSPGHGFYGIPFISENHDQATNATFCSISSEIPCMTGNLKCVPRSYACWGYPRCPDGSDVSSYHAGCFQRDINSLYSFERNQTISSNSSNWNIVQAYQVPPYDHTTFSPDGHVMKSWGRISSLQMKMIPIDVGDTPKCLSFWYFTHGLVQSLEVIMKRNSPLTFSYVAWMARGDADYGWKLGEIQLDGSWGTSIYIKFVSKQESDASVSIDDISLYSGSCSGEDISCTFDLGYCGWTLNQFVVNSSTPYLSQQNAARDFYDFQPIINNIVLARLSRNLNEATMLSGPVTLRSPMACLSFSYLIGGSVDQCSILVSGMQPNGTMVELWSQTSGVVFEWKIARVAFETSGFGGLARLQIKAISNNLLVDVVVSIDNVTFTPGRCLSSSSPSILPPFFLPISTPKMQSTTEVRGQSCNARSFRCISGEGCINRSSVCNGIIDCMDASDEIDCPRTGGPLKYSESSLQPSFLIAITVTVTVLVVSTLAVLLFFVSRRLARGRHRPQRYTQSCHDLPDGPTEIPKPPPYSLHPPPYSLQAPPYSSREDITLKDFDSPPPPFSELEHSI